MSLQTDEFYVNFEIANTPIQPTGTDDFTLTTVESIDYLLPTFTFTFQPPKGVFYHELPLTGLELFRAEYGQNVNDQNLTKSDYRILQSTPGDQANKQTNPEIVMRGVLDGVKHLRSTNRQAFDSLPSEAVQSLVNPVTSNTQIEDTHKSLDRKWIQPNWRNQKMVEYLRQNSVNTQGLGPYYAYFDNDSRFTFRSLDRLYDQSLPDDGSRYLRLAPGEDNDNKASQSDVVDDDNKELNLIIDFSWHNDVRVGLDDGVYGYETSSYDYENSEWVTNNKTIQDIGNHKTLTDRLVSNRDDVIEGMPTDSESGYRGLVNGTNENEYFTNSGVIEANSKVSVLDVTLRQRLPNVYAGNTVRVDVHDEVVEGNRLDVLSGTWLVHTKKEIVDSMFVTRLRLIRDGVNDPPQNIERFSKSRGGKVSR